MFVERMIQQIFPGKWEELDELDEKYTTYEDRLGFPPKRRFHCMTGSYDTNTVIIEREWESLAVMEEIYTKAFADPAYQKLGEEASSIVKSSQVELYRPMS